MEPPADEDSDSQLSAEKYYDSETLHSRPFVTPDSDIPENLLHLWYYASSKHVLLQTIFFPYGKFSSQLWVHRIMNKQTNVLPCIQYVQIHQVRSS